MAELSEKLVTSGLRVLAPLFAISLAASLAVAASGAASAQRGDNYVLQLDERTVSALAERAGEAGITAADFSRWFGANARMGVEQAAPRPPVPAQLHVLVADASGRIAGRASVRAEVSERGDVRLNQRELERAVTQAFPGDMFFPTDTFHKHNPDVDFFPTDTFITSARELDQVAVSFGQRARREGYALFITLTPDDERFDPPVNPGAVAVAGRFD
jgi:hypothetical protein